MQRAGNEGPTADSTRRPRWRPRAPLDALASLAMIAAAVTLISANWPRARPARTVPKLPTEPVSLVGAPQRGNPNAQIAIIEYSDYQCPFCRKFEQDVLPDLDKSYIQTGQVVLAFKHRPIAEIHSMAVPSAIAAVCASRQDKFWPFHKALNGGRNARELNEAAVEEAASAALVDKGMFASCRGSDDARVEVEREMEVALALQVSVTPTFLIGKFVERDSVRVSVVITGAKPLTAFAEVLNKLLRDR